jgi:hypothetical protein
MKWSGLFALGDVFWGDPLMNSCNFMGPARFVPSGRASSRRSTRDLRSAVLTIVDRMDPHGDSAL